MKPRDIAELILLASLWGASFLFMRLGAGEFGAVALATVRVGGAAAFLLPLLALRGELGALRVHWRPLLIVGLLNSALPFVCFAFAALAINAGLAAIFNATAPMWSALIAWLWLKDRLTAPRALGLLIGFAGVVWLAWDKASFKPGDHGVSPAAAIVACVFATLCYGIAATYTKRRLAGVPPMAVAAGSQLSAACLLALPGALLWPAVPPGAVAWGAVIALAVVSTGIAYVLFFRLIARVGPSNAISVTYLIPLFAVLWGAIFLAEPLTGTMAGGCAVILIGTALATGVLRWPQRGRPAAAD